MQTPDQTRGPAEQAEDDQTQAPPGPTPSRDGQAEGGTDPKKGLDREVGAFDDPDAQDDDDALPGHAGGGLAGG